MKARLVRADERREPHVTKTRGVTFVLPVATAAPAAAPVPAAGAAPPLWPLLAAGAAAAPELAVGAALLGKEADEWPAMDLSVGALDCPGPPLCVLCQQAWQIHRTLVCKVQQRGCQHQPLHKEWRAPAKGGKRNNNWRRLIRSELQ